MDRTFPVESFVFLRKALVTRPCIWASGTGLAEPLRGSSESTWRPVSRDRSDVARNRPAWWAGNCHESGRYDPGGNGECDGAIHDEWRRASSPSALTDRTIAKYSARLHREREGLLRTGCDGHLMDEPSCSWTLTQTTSGASGRCPPRAGKPNSTGSISILSPLELPTPHGAWELVEPRLECRRLARSRHMQTLGTHESWALDRRILD